MADDLINQSTAIDILIGFDYYWALVAGEVLKTDGGPIAISQGIHYPLTIYDALLCTLKCFWQLESLGITDA